MSSLIGNNETRFVHEQANTIDCSGTAIPIKIPFPPPISAKDLVAQRKNGEVPSRSPNAFLIYRRVVVKELQAQNCAFKMTDVSSMASASWKLEPEHVKQAYLQIAGEAKNMLTSTRHKSLSFSRRKWRTQNRSNNDNNTRTPKTKTLSTPSASQTPRKNQATSTNTPQLFQSEPKNQFVQPLNISQPTIDNIEDRLFFSPSFAVCMEDVDNYLFAANNRDIIWNQSPVSDILAYSDGESSDVGIDDMYEQPTTLPTLNSEKMSIMSYRQFMINWHVVHLQLAIFNNELNKSNIINQLY